MPIYVYECTKCSHQFELLQSFSDPPPKSCPECSAAVRKLLFPPAVIFKGSGFYATEYGRSKSSTTPTEKKTDDSSTSSSSSDAKKTDTSAPKTACAAEKAAG